jgi:hypothetical protein
VSIVSVLQIRIFVHLSVNGCECTQLHVQVVFSGVWPSFFVTIIFALPSSRYLFSLSAVYYFLLRTVLCLRSFFALNDWPFMKYASNYFFFVRRLLACLFCITPPLVELVFAHARFSSHLFLVSCSRVSWIGHPLPSLSHHLAEASQPIVEGRHNDDESETLCDAK